MSDQSTADHRQAIQVMHARAGRNVIRVQSLETGLKTLLPFIHHNEAHCLARLTERRQAYLRKTLGELIGMFVDSAESHDSSFKTALTKIVDDRNRLVHHFHEVYGATAASGVQGCMSVIDVLDIQFLEVRALEQLINEILVAVLHGLRDVTFAGTPEYDEFALICEEFQAAVLQATNPPSPTN